MSTTGMIDRFFRGTYRNRWNMLLVVVGRSGARCLKGSTNRALLAKQTRPMRCHNPLEHAPCGRVPGVLKVPTNRVVGCTVTANKIAVDLKLRKTEIKQFRHFQLTLLC
jgi:hypothetical protein